MSAGLHVPPDETEEVLDAGAFHAGLIVLVLRPWRLAERLAEILLV